MLLSCFVVLLVIVTKNGRSVILVSCMKPKKLASLGVKNLLDLFEDGVQI